MFIIAYQYSSATDRLITKAIVCYTEKEYRIVKAELKRLENKGSIKVLEFDSVYKATVLNHLF